MAKIIQFPQTDERPDSISFDEDGDGWWAGAQRCFVAVPVAATLAAVVLSASLSWGYQQQTDEIIPKQVEEEYWQQPYSITPPIQLSGPVWDDQIPAGVLFGQPDEDSWQVYTPLPPPPWFLYLPDPEELPAGFLHGQPDEDYWQVYTPPPLAAKPLYLPDPEEIPAGALFGVPDEVYWLAPPPLQAAIWTRAWIADDEITPTFTPDEDSWQVYTPAQSAAKLLYLPDPEEIPAGLLFGVPEEDPWPCLIPPRVIVTLQPWADEEIVPQPSLVSLDESYWQGFISPPPSLPFLWPPWQHDEVIPKPSIVSVGGAVWLTTTQGAPILLPFWGATDELPTAAPLSVDEEPWAQPPVRSRGKLIQLFWAADPLPTVTVSVGEGAVWLTTAPSRPVVLPAWWGSDEIVPQPAAFGRDEEPWWVPTPAWPAARPLYLPDPEEIPAASLFGVPPAVAVRIVQTLHIT